MVSYASDETEDDITFTHSMTRMVIRVAEPTTEAAHVDKDNVDVGAAGQGIMFGFASGEMGDEMPLPHKSVCMLARIC